MKKRIGWILCALALALGIGCGVYLADFYSAEPAALEAMAGTTEIAIWRKDNQTCFAPSEAVSGFLFYPGGKVEAASYAPLMRALAERNIFCVLVEMPFHLAVLDMDAAEGIPEKFPEVQRWYIGGHSLGGSMAASYVSQNADRYEGLVLLAAYSTADLTESGLQVLSLYGDRDEVLNLEKYGQYRENLPESAKEEILPGANHAGFGSYGAQEGDGVSSLPEGEQIAVTAEILAEFFTGGKSGA